MAVGDDGFDIVKAFDESEKKLQYERARTDFRAMDIFRHFIGFLEVFGNENYGNFEVNWVAVYRFCHQYHLLDFNEELEDIIYAKTDEEFRDKCYSYIEKQVLDGYPIHRLFYLNEYLTNYYEAEVIARENAKDKEYFKKTRCYRCKHFVNSLTYFNINHDPKHASEFKDVPDKYKSGNIIQHMNCGKRRELLDDFQIEHNVGRFGLRQVKLKYKQFNCIDVNGWSNQDKWQLNPMKLKRCPYFEKSGITFEDFLAKWGSLYRLSKED